MRVTRPAARLVALTLLCAITAHSQGPRPTPAPPRSDEIAESGNKDTLERRLLIVADNQEHVLTGVQLKSMGLLSELFISSVALRPPLAHVGGRLLLGEALRFGKREGTDLVLHLGDATNISCPNELTSVFELLDKEAPRDGAGKPMWFMAPGNHDGMLAGNLAGKQPGLKFRLTEEDVRAFYDQQPQDGLSHNIKSWPFACVSPNREYEKKGATSSDDRDMLKKGILTRGDAIKLYVDMLEKRGAKPHKFSKDPFTYGSSESDSRPDAFCKDKSSEKDKLGEETICIADTPIICDVKKIEIKSQGYTAIARICPATPVKGKAGDKEGKWVGPFASYIVQRIEVGGTPIILLDTTDYYNPTRFPVPLGGALTASQQKHADYLLFTSSARDSFGLINRDKAIVAGHHPLDDLPREQQRWLVERTSRYISAHVHRSTQLVSHNLSKGRRTVDLNIGSTLDYPPQVVIAKLTPNEMRFRVAGADLAKTGWPGFLEQCYRRREEWMLQPCTLYKGYRRGTYVKRLLESLNAAAKNAPASPPLVIPTGDHSDDWKRLDTALQAINDSEGEAATFWACQSFYASEATQGEESLRERVERWLRQSTKSGEPATGGWIQFGPGFKATPEVHQVQRPDFAPAADSSCRHGFPSRRPNK